MRGQVLLEGHCFLDIYLLLKMRGAAQCRASTQHVQRPEVQLVKEKKKEEEKENGKEWHMLKGKSLQKGGGKENEGG